MVQCSEASRRWQTGGVGGVTSSATRRSPMRIVLIGRTLAAVAAFALATAARADQASQQCPPAPTCPPCPPCPNTGPTPSSGAPASATAVPAPTNAAPASPTVEPPSATAAQSPPTRFGAVPTTSVPASVAAHAKHKAYVLALGEVVGIDLAIWGWDYLTGAPFAQINSQTIGDNFHKGWIIDTDDFWANSLMHPVHGNLTFNAARSLGLNFYESFAYSFLGSYLWEQFLEIQPPSINDMVNTPFGGSLLGEALFRMSRLILDGNGYSPGFLRQLFAFLINPVGGLNRLAFGNKYRGELLLPDSWMGEFRFGAVLAGSNHTSGAAASGVSIGPWTSLSAKIVYNVPGTPGLVLEKPFDHFDFDASISFGGNAAAQPAASMRIRGLVVGDTLS